MTGTRGTADSGGSPSALNSSGPDAAVREIVQLLGLVAEEEQALARLDRCVTDLHRIAVARAALAGCTDTELAEAHAWADRSTTVGGSPMLPVISVGEVAS